MLYKGIWDDYTGEESGYSRTDLLQVNCSFTFQLHMTKEQPQSDGEALGIHKWHDEIT